MPLREFCIKEANGRDSFSPDFVNQSFHGCEPSLHMIHLWLCGTMKKYFRMPGQILENLSS